MTSAPTTARARWIERHPTAVSLLLVAVGCGIALIAVELGFRAFGLADPVLYDSNALYGYRPIPNQRQLPLIGPNFRFNNLGLRCDDDWDARPDGRVLFLGDSVTFGGNVDNDELFSALATKDLAGQRSCNGGVNAWGVENIHGLLVESGFLPAQTYVIVLIEDDFYRGLTRVQGQLLWSRPPASAVGRALLDFLHGQDERRRYLNWALWGTPEVMERVVDKAVRRLAELEQILRSQGFAHLLYISPMRKQMLGNAPKDERVARLLAAHGVEATYLVDVVGTEVRERSEREALYHDNVHLSPKGHAVWAAIINRDLRRLSASPSESH